MKTDSDGNKTREYRRHGGGGEVSAHGAGAHTAHRFVESHQVWHVSVLTLQGSWSSLSRAKEHTLNPGGRAGTEQPIAISKAPLAKPLNNLVFLFRFPPSLD